MPGPMSVPNGSNRIYKITEGDRTIYVSIHDLTWKQRERLAREGKLDTGKTKRRS